MNFLDHVLFLGKLSQYDQVIIALIARSLKIVTYEKKYIEAGMTRCVVSSKTHFRFFLEISSKHVQHCA